MKISVKFSEAQAEELRKLAAKGGTNLVEVIKGIVQLYLDGRVKASPATQKFVETVLAAAQIYAPTTKPSTHREGLLRAKARGVKIGRPPQLSDAKQELARALRAEGKTYGEIGEKLGVDYQVVRRVCLAG